MVITIELPEEIASELKRDAEREGIPVEEVVAGFKTLFIEWLQREMQQRDEEEPPEQEVATDPETIINAAVRQMYENQVKNRELAVAAITQKNNLQAETAKLERQVADLEQKAAQTLKAGNRELAKQFFQEKQQHEELLFEMRKNLLIATEETEKIKLAIKHEEARVRKTTAEALSAKATLRQTEMLRQIYESSESLALHSEEEADRKISELAFALWVEEQKEPRAPEEELEQSIITEMQELRARMEKLEREWLRYDIWKHKRKTGEAAS